MELREITVDDSVVGLTLAYDLTEITPGVAKGAVLRRGHVITPGDLETLRDIGKSHIVILDLGPDDVHEDDAAERLGRLLGGEGIEVRLPGEAWADLVATRNGLLKVDDARLLRMNLLDDLLLATRHNNSPVRQGDVVAKVKVRGLSVQRAVLEEAELLAAGDTRVVRILLYRPAGAAAVITGREIFEGRKKDAFEPLLRGRLKEYGSDLARVEIVPDDIEHIGRAIDTALARGVDVVFVTGGGSPDDSTGAAIARVADEVVVWGVPVSPGAMTVLAYAGTVPILGVSGGLLARPRGFFDLILPRLLARERLTKEDVAPYGHGGLCLGCPTCVFPACPFGC